MSKVKIELEINREQASLLMQAWYELASNKNFVHGYDLSIDENHFDISMQLEQISKKFKDFDMREYEPWLENTGDIWPD